MTTAHAEAGTPPTKSSLGRLVLAALGVVFGDIGTSPLYAIKETFAGPHPLPVDPLHVLGILSLVFWAITGVVSIKYLAVIMRADNRGEGGTLALLALLGRATADRPALAGAVGALGIFAAALFYGDSTITPAISVLSAVEGLRVVLPRLETFTVPLAVAILVGLFLIQRRGSAALGVLFGPVIVLWFVALLVLGIRSIGAAPEVLAALSPHFAVAFLMNDGLKGFLALGSVVLAVTGAEALYADMGHFGRLPIRLAWSLLVLPALVVNYFGQGALLLGEPGAVRNPFFLLAPQWAGIPLLVLATMATVIASQAVISGAFSITQQAIQLGYLPRMKIVHTSARERGQIYLPFVNGALMILVTGLVLGFQTSSNLASAYGVAVTGTMLITTVLAALVMFRVWGWRSRWIRGMVGLFLVVDLTFFFLLRQHHQGDAWRLVPAGAGFGRLRAADHVEAGPRAAGRAARPGRDAGRNALGFAVGPDSARARHGGLPDRRETRRSVRVAAQPEAQPGPARTGRAAHRVDR